MGSMVQSSLTVRALAWLGGVIAQSRTYGLLAALFGGLGRMLGGSFLGRMLLADWHEEESAAPSYGRHLLRTLGRTAGGWLLKLGPWARSSWVVTRMPVAVWLPLFFLAAPFLSTTLDVLWVLGMGLLWALGEAARGRVVVHSHPLARPIGFFYLLLVPAGLAAISPKEGLLTLTLWTVYFLFFFLVVQGVEDRSGMELVAAMMGLAAIGTGILGLDQWVRHVQTPSGWLNQAANPTLHTRIFSVFGNPDLFAMFLVAVLPFAYVLLRQGSSVRMRLVGLLALAVGGPALVLTFSRGGLLGLAIGMLIFFILLERWILPYALLASLALPFLSPRVLLNRFSTLTNLLHDHSILFRIDIWKGTWAFLHPYWMSGLGLGNGSFTLLYPRTMWSAVWAVHTQNLWLELLLDAGIFAVLAFTYVIIVFFRTVRLAIGPLIRRDRLMAWYLAAAMAGLIANLFQGLVDYIWYDPHGVFYMWGTMALAMVAVRLGREGGEGAADPAGRQ